MSKWKVRVSYGFKFADGLYDNAIHFSGHVSDSLDVSVALSRDWKISKLWKQIPGGRNVWSYLPEEKWSEIRDGDSVKEADCVDLNAKIG